MATQQPGPSTGAVLSTPSRDKPNEMLGATLWRGASPAEARAIARDAVIYGFPLVDSYRIQHSYFVDRASTEFKAPWNTIFNNARVYTPDDKAIQTPNSDTPYSYVGVDLRAEPVEFSVPAIDRQRYYSLQFIDMYTFNFAYVGSRATGNGAGNYLLAGPRWRGEKPRGIDAIIHCETDFAFVLYRTQLLNPDDIGAVRKIQAGYVVQTLSEFLAAPPAAAAAKIDFIRPLKPDEQRKSLQFFNVLNFVLQFCPVHASEQALRQRFARIGIVPGATIDPDDLSADMREALIDGMADAWAEFAQFKQSQIDTGRKSSADSFGTREFLHGSYIDRMSGAALGIYGNSQEEAIYPAYFVDLEGARLDGAGKYSMRFAVDELPPVNAFWSLTAYQLPASLLYANPLHRYLINSPMLPRLTRDADGGLTIYVQNESPGKRRESNWLPVPRGPFFLAMRLYWPKSEALNGQWRAPQLRRAMP